jgi:hypothetical protein
MINQISDQAYLGIVADKIKHGKSYDCCHRYSQSQYNAGGLYQLPSVIYFAVPALPFPIDRMEEIYYTHFYKYLLPVRGNFRKRLEYIDPRYTDITVEHVQNVMESYIRSEGIQVRRLKTEFIATIPFNSRLSEEVRSDYLKYTDPV